MRAESAVEPTRSENITVTWRRSARSSGAALGVLGVVFRSLERRLSALVAAQSSDGIQQLHAVAQCRDAKLLQVLVRQARQDRFVYLILAECRLILSEAQAPQPHHDVHDGALNGLPIMIV